jgi:hypothetical protein
MRHAVINDALSADWAGELKFAARCACCDRLKLAMSSASVSRRYR